MSRPITSIGKITIEKFGTVQSTDLNTIFGKVNKLLGRF